MSPGSVQRQTMTVEEFAVMAGVGRTTAYEAARRGEIPVRRIGSRFVVPVEAARRWLGEFGDSLIEPSPASSGDVDHHNNVTPIRHDGDSSRKKG